MKRRLSSLWTSIKSPFKRREHTANILGNFDSETCAEPLPPNPGPTTMDTLIDDCLVPILAHIPLTEQISSIPLTCSRWNSLLDRVHQQRTQLVIWNTDWSPPESGRFPQLFTHPPPWEALPYTDYLTHLFNDSDLVQMTTLNPDYCIQNRPIEASICKQLGVSFPNLTDLSLVDARLKPNSLSHLLAHFRIKLRSLSLIDVNLIFPKQNAGYVRASVHRILAVIDSMPSLTRLGLQNFHFNDYPHPDLANELSTVLPNLIEFYLGRHENNVYPILERLDENKLRRLSLGDTVWPDEGMLSRLVASKPALRNLTHLTLSVFEYTSGEDIDYHSVAHLRTLERIVKAFPQLVYFDFFTENTLSDMLPYFSKLKQLVTLKLVSPGWGLFAGPLAWWSRRRLATNSLKSVKSLTLSCCCEVDITDDFSSIRALFPKLEKLYLDSSQFSCTCLPMEEEDGEVEEDDEEDEEEEVNLEGQMEDEDQAENQVENQVEGEANIEEDDVDEEDQEEEEEIHEEENEEEEEAEVSRFIKLPAQQAAGCVCKVRLLAQLAKFKNLPQMSVNYAFSKKSQQSN